MSAFIVEDSVIDYVLSAYVEAMRPYGAALYFSKGPGDGYDVYEPDDNGLSRLGQAILDENYASVNYRYNEQQNGAPYIFRKHRGVYEAAAGGKVVLQALKAIACIEYQSCEHPGWEDSLSFKALNQIRARLVSRMPGYEPLEWGAPEHPAAGKGVFSLSDMAKGRAA